jgi:hypothetical protein
MKGFKTLLFAAILAIAGVLEQFDWLSIVPEGFGGIALAVIGVIVAWLRKVTTTPIGKSV